VIRDPGIVSEKALVPIVQPADQELKPPGLKPAGVVGVAAWIGLVAGLIDLGLMVGNRLIDGDFYRLGSDFVWMIPLGVATLTLLPSALLILLAWLLRRYVRLGIAVGLSAFVGALELCARLPLELWASLLLSAGLAVQCARLAGGRMQGFLKLVRHTIPVFIGMLLLAVGGTIGVRSWTEHRATRSLPPASPGARNILLIVWDTVRAANLGLYGYARQTTPNLERLARRGVRFDLAFATSSWTLPSHASLFTGRWPHEVGVDWKRPLADGSPTLAEYLSSHGYDTSGFVANLDYCSSETGLARGFAHYEDYPLDPYDTFTRYLGLGRRLEVAPWVCILERLAEKVLGRSPELVPRASEHAKRGADVDHSFLRWLSWQRPRRRPFFAFLNYNDAHTPYQVPDRSTAAFGVRPATCSDRLTLLRWNVVEKANLSEHDVRMAVDVYDDAILYLDRRLGGLLEELTRRGVLDDTLIIVAADHGEHLGDHLLFFHGCSLYRQLVQVPLVIVDQQRVPAGRSVPDPVSLRDVPATVAALLKFTGKSPFPGQSLERFWAPIAGADRPVADPLLLETGKPLVLTNQGREPAAKGAMTSLILGERHYIRLGDGSEELYSLSSDPEERFNLAGAFWAREDLQRCRDRLTAMRWKK
jgi:arylsulfatase A-like enzyme